jgi:hypothetical protein
LGYIGRLGFHELHPILPSFSYVARLWYGITHTFLTTEC